MRARLILTLAVCLLTAPAWAATPTHDATENLSGTVFVNAQNPSYTYDPSGGACPNSVAIITIAFQDSTPGTLSSVTYDGNAATSLGNAVSRSANNFLQGFIYKNSGTSAVTVQANFSEVMNSVSIRTSTYCNVHQTDSVGTLATNTGAADTTVTVDVTSATGALVIDAAHAGSAALTLSVGADQTERYNQLAATNHVHAGSEEAGASTVTMSWTEAVLSSWAILGISLKPSSDRRPVTPLLLN